MSGGTFHVHGPHDHELEHAVQHAGEHGDAQAHHGLGGGSMTNQIALFTAVISTVGAIFAYMGGLTQANAILDKNMAALRKTEASNQWNYYQSKSSKQNLSELALVLVSDDKKPQYAKEIDRYKGEKAEIKLAADKLEAESASWDRKSDAELHLHHRWAQATTIIQVSIALAAIALLTKKKWMEYAMFGTGAAGMAIGIAASLHV